jgi:LysM repeat protein
MDQKNSKPWALAAGMLLIAVLMTCALAAGSAALQTQPAHAQIPIYTPTPGPDGRIIYVVRANDTLMGIALIMNVPIEKLRELNNLSGDTIFEGQKLLLGLSGPLEITPTFGPPPTATPLLPTPSPKPGQGSLCILLFEDLNGDSIREEDEPSLPNGAISFGNQAATVSQAVDSGAGSEHQCFDNLPEGNYTISVAVPEGYNPTTETEYEVALKAGDKTYVNFGAQANSQTEAASAVIPDTSDQRSPVLGIIGGLFLLAGVGLAIYAARVLRH